MIPIGRSVSLITSKKSKRQNHIFELCDHYGILVFEKERTIGYAHYETKFKQKAIEIRPTYSPSSYFIALHEIGHLVAKGRTVGGILEREAKAWQWALDNAIEPPTIGVWRTIYHCLTSYYETAKISSELYNKLREKTRDNYFYPSIRF